MNYTPHTERDVQRMLDVLGLETTADLFEPVPEALRLKRLDVAPGISEMEARAAVSELTSRLRRDAPCPSFLGLLCVGRFLLPATSW